jgi:Zn-dependent protease with chaperone function
MDETTRSFAGYASLPNSGGKAVNGTIFVEWRKVRFESEEIAGEIPLDRIVIEFAGKNRERICFRDAAVPGVEMVTFDDSIFDHRAFHHSRNAHNQLIQAAQRGELWRRARLTFYALLACGVAAWLVSFISNAVVGVLVKGIPAEWEIKFGDDVFKKIQDEVVFVDDSNRVARLTALAQPLIRTVPAKGIPFRFHIMESDYPNAFALPGGHIVVSTRLLEMADTPEELLGVIAHEMAHVTRKHAFRHLISGKGPIIILQISTGGRNRLLDVLAYPSEKLIYESFSQEYEKEADLAGWNSLLVANINPQGMIEMFKKLETFEGVEGLGRSLSAFDSHPALERRIGWLQAKWDKLPRKTDFLELTNAMPGADVK